MLHANTIETPNPENRDAARVAMVSENAARLLAAKYATQGMPCEIEAGKIGLVIYASTRVDAFTIARDIAREVVRQDPKAIVTLPVYDPDEPAATSWWAGVDIDWRGFV